MKKRISKKSIDSVKRRSTKCSSVLNLKKLPKKKVKSRIFFAWKARKINISFLHKSLVKTTALLLIISLNFSAISLIGGTRAYFHDTELSQNNLFSAGILDFSLDFLASDGFRTQTQGGWGTRGNGQNPGVYRNANFEDAFPSGMTIGDNATEYYAHFSSSLDVENFLPSGGTAGFFEGNYLNSIKKTEAGILAGQVVALSLNVGFDNFDSDFSLNESKFQDFYANSAGSLCENMTVGEVLAEANLILSQQPVTTLTPSESNECVSEINEKFNDGLVKKITPIKSVWREITIIKHDGINFRHNMQIEQTSGDVDFCNALVVDSYLNGVAAYSGNLLNFDYDFQVFSDSANKWRLDIGLPSGAPSLLKNKTCKLNYIVSGQQESGGILVGGFSDVEEVSDSIESGEWGIRINKVYYDVASDRGNEGGNEWIEIYNQTNDVFDISDWEICDNNSCDTIPSSSVIPANSFGIITASDSTWNYWETPNNIVKIVVPSSSIGNGLHNNADMLILKNSNGDIVDQMNWGAPDSEWSNYNGDVWNPGAIDVAEGNIIGRITVDDDTNQRADFIEFGPPIVDLIYPDQSGQLVWYWTYDYTIQWTADNFNGSNDELSVDLYYIKDIDQNQVISDEDTEHIIATNIANSGSYLWEVPSGFLGYIWIKIVSTGVENPMLNDAMISGKIYDPIPSGLWNVTQDLFMSQDNEICVEEPLFEEIIVTLDLEEMVMQEPVVVSEVATNEIEELFVKEVPVEPEEETETEVVLEEIVEENLSDDFVVAEKTEELLSDEMTDETAVIDDLTDDDELHEEDIEIEASTESEDEIIPEVIPEEMEEDISNDLAIEVDELIVEESVIEEVSAEPEEEIITEVIPDKEVIIENQSIVPEEVSIEISSDEEEIKIEDLPSVESKENDINHNEDEDEDE
ncbi:MAG: lamin tail domain-containing protein [Candidatus Pacebacteria bacterium]|nr:lamin tail domain-containing protein [Candidatus Paceibacterota bacterium]